MTDREKLIELLLGCDPIKERDLDDDWHDGELEEIADHLLANGVTFAKDMDVPSKWISMAERKPEDDLPANSKKKQIKVLAATVPLLFVQPSTTV